MANAWLMFLLLLIVCSYILFIFPVANTAQQQSEWYRFGVASVVVCGLGLLSGLVWDGKTTRAALNRKRRWWSGRHLWLTELLMKLLMKDAMNFYWMRLFSNSVIKESSLEGGWTIRLPDTLDAFNRTQSHKIKPGHDLRQFSLNRASEAFCRFVKITQLTQGSWPKTTFCEALCEYLIMDSLNGVFLRD